jgi:hypothetical protein
VSGHKTPAQKVAALERAERRALHRLSKATRSQHAHRMIVLAGAVAAEMRDDPERASWVREVVLRRVMRPHDLAAVLEWLSTI